MGSDGPGDAAPEARADLFRMGSYGPGDAAPEARADLNSEERMTQQRPPQKQGPICIQQLKKTSNTQKMPLIFDRRGIALETPSDSLGYPLA